VLAGFAAWTKDEGLLFLAILFAAMAALRRPGLLRFCCGAAPAAALVLVFKFVIARGTHSLVSTAQNNNMTAKLSDWSRVQLTAAAMAREGFTWNSGWYHPILPLLVLAIVLRFDRRQMRDGLFCLAIGLSLLLGYFGVYVITPNDLQ
jgi:hypothetical protein